MSDRTQAAKVFLQVQEAMAEAKRPTKAEARAAFKELMWELPWDFCQPLKENPMEERTSFWVHLRKNVRAVHRALLVLQDYFEIDPNEQDWAQEVKRNDPPKGHPTEGS